MQVEASTSSSSSSNATSVAEAALPSFARGVVALLAIWPALRLAVTHNWKPSQTAVQDPEFPPENGGQKRTRLAEELVDAYFSTYTSPNTLGKVPESEEIEDFLLDFFEYEYGVKLEDMSEVQVRKDIEELWKECIARSSGQSSSQALLEKFERMADKAKSDDADPSKAFKGTTTGNEDDDDDESGTDGDDSDEEMEGADQSRSSASHPNGHQHREEPQVDEDGFTTVTKSSKGRH